jgi:hypothetical protein
MSRFKIRWIALAAVLGFFVAEQGLAQRRPQQPPKPQGKPITKHGPVKGTVEMTQGGMLKVVGTPGAPGETWIVAAEPGATIKVTGTAEVAYLKPRHYIRFSGMVEKKSIVKDPVSKLTLYTPLASPMAGGPGGPAGKPAGGGLAELGGAAAKLAETEASPMTVAGQITMIKGNKVTMNVPGVSPKLQVELADNAAIEVDMGDLSAVRPGDTVEITGGTNYGAQILAKEMQVTLAQPLGAATAKKKPAAATSKPEGKPGKKAGGFPFGENK